MRKSLEKNADDRYQDALEFADALQEAMVEAEQKAFASIRPGGTTECPSCLANVPAHRQTFPRLT